MTLWITCLSAFFHTTTFAADAPMCIRYKGSDLYEKYETRRRQSFGFMFDWNKHNLDPYLCTAEYIQIVYTTYDLSTAKVATTTTPSLNATKSPAFKFSTTTDTRALTATMASTSLDSSSSAASSSPTIANVTGQPTTMAGTTATSASTGNTTHSTTSNFSTSEKSTSTESMALLPSTTSHGEANTTASSTTTGKDLSTMRTQG
ncbi:unnamed protein product [Cylicocyclus nassatus]|uniref:Uncharacterized protein n=1 Tax=Cylicocyclus nassatus TaxID=53992 RepID=A0AA36GMF3_CYLNA|nr:unnamed protein product [Cylicocyclus nassatus]